MALGVELQAGETPVLGGDGVAQRLGAPGDGVLVDVGLDRLAGGVLERLGRGEIGEALGQVDAVGEVGRGASSRG